MTLLSPFLLSNLGFVSLQWILRRDGDFWFIENLANKEFANLERDDPILPGVPVITSRERKWQIHPDPEFGGFR